jgi:cytochrome b involved in lipid metabolism
MTRLTTSHVVLSSIFLVSSIYLPTKRTRRNTNPIQRMPPDAQKLRQRRKPESLAASERVCTLAQLRSTEVCIEGIVYNLEGFDHPGGDSIRVFGGNDVTTLYKMIHPHHASSSTTTYLDKKLERLGTVSDYQLEYVGAGKQQQETHPHTITHSFTRTHCIDIYTDTSSTHPLNEKSNKKYSRLSVAASSLARPVGTCAAPVTSHSFSTSSTCGSCTAHRGA